MGKPKQARKPKHEPTEDEKAFKSWQRQIPGVNARTNLGCRKLSIFIQSALNLVLKEDAGVRQSVIRELASEGGLFRVSELIDCGDLEHDLEEGFRAFEERQLPFLRIITHIDVLSSLVLQKSLGDIYVFLHGVRGRRAVKWFNDLTGILQAKARTMQITETSNDTYSWAAIILTALSQLLDVSQSASVNQDLHPVVDTLQGLLNGASSTLSGTLLEQTATQQMIKVRRHLNYGANLETFAPKTVERPRGDAAFEHQIDGPGHISQHGARHDNDKAFIMDIKILPTWQEIVSERAEYLPTRNYRKWHRPGVHGLLDQQFRLLREDTV